MKIQALPEGQDLLSRVLEEGSLHIAINNRFSKQFDGYWDAPTRTVYITKSRKSSERDLLPVLVFELHNASRQSDFKRIYELAWQGQIDKWHYVEAIEYIEYQNAVATSMLLNKGIEEGIFPQGLDWFIPDTFQEHFEFQQTTGHSDWIARGYERIRPQEVEQSG